MFILICRYNRVFAYPGDDITLSSHLSPETSAVPMEVRWFRGTECIYLYKNGQVSIGKGYEGRAGMLTPELKRGNVSLILKSISPVDTGIYTCHVLTGHNKVEKSVHLYMSGMEPLSPDIIGPKLTDQDSVDLEESVVILELKKLLQQREKELQDKTKELETTSEMLRTKTSLLLYTDMDLENMSKLANQKEEHLKDMVSELKACKRQVETLGQKLQEKTVQVDELQAVVRDKKEKTHLGGIYEEQHFTENLKSTAQYTADREEPAHSPELMVLLQNQEKELEEKSEQLERSTAALTRMTQMLQDRNTDVENLTKERDEYVKNVTGEIEMCLQELETLGLKLQEKNAEVEELRGFLNHKGLELEKGRERQGGSGHVITVNQAVGVSHEPFVSELLEKSEDVLSRIYHNPKEQLAEIESWIYAKREERRLREEKERTDLLEKEFIDYVSAVKELIEKKTEKIVAWEQMMAVLENKLEVVETDEEREVLDMQLQEAVGMQKQGQEQIERLSKGIEEKRSGIEEKHKHMMEEIHERYSAVARIEAETDILKIVLPDVQTYFRNVAADMKRSLDAWSHVMQTIQIPVDAQTTDHTNVGIRVQKEHRTDSSAEELEVVEMRSAKSSPEVNNNCFQTFIRKVDARPRVAGEPYGSKSEDTDSEDESNETLNSMMMIKRETRQEQEEVREVNEYDETGEEDTA